MATVNAKGGMFNTYGPGDPPALSKWPAEIGCHANSKMPATAAKMWLSRLWIKSPEGCYAVQPGMGMHKGISAFYVKPDAATPNLASPYLKGSTTEIDKDYICMYKCVAWKSVSMQGTMLKSGVIIAGGAFIERFTNFVTCKWGYAFITTSSSPAFLRQTFNVMIADRSRWNPVGGSTLLLRWRRSVFILAMVFIELTVMWVAPMISVDGYYTTDYYVTSAIMLSIALASLLRNCNLLRGRRPVFTQNIWSNGTDEFYVRSIHKTVPLDLYEWKHLPDHMKAQVLLDYARRVDIGKEAHEFDLEHFFQRRRAQKKGSSCLQANPAAADGVQDRLVVLEKRLSNLEEAWTKASPGTGDAVVCIKNFESFADVFMEDESGDWLVLKMQLKIKAGATGRLLGKTIQGLLMVEWFNNKLDKTTIPCDPTDKFCYPDDTIAKPLLIALAKAPTFLAEIKPHNVLETNDEWEEMQAQLEVVAEILKKDMAY